MKVKNLIELLQKFDGESEVLLPGNSDSDGWASVTDVTDNFAIKVPQTWRGSWEIAGIDDTDDVPVVCIS